MRKDADRYKEGTGDYDTSDDYDAPDEHAVAGDGYDDPGDGYDGYDGYDGSGDGYDGTGDYDAPEDFPDLYNPGPYWRRRFIILAAGIVALGLCVWLLPGGHPAAAGTSASALASRAALARGSSLPSSAYGTSYPGPTTKWPSGTASPSIQPSPTASASHPAAAKSKPVKGKARGTGHDPGASAGPAAEPRCKPASIVLSLFTSQASYASDAPPSFSVYAVSTSATPCTLTYGTGSVHVAVTSHGRVIWDSAACKPPAAPRVRFTLGVPQVLTIGWNRKAAGPSGCAGSLPAGATGTFDAVAVTVGQSSPVRQFKLEKPRK